MYDPLGFIGPVIVIAKIIMQKLWLEKLDSNQIPQLANLKIPRYVLKSPQFFSIEIHGFADASMIAYGACICLRTMYKDNSVKCSLVASKSNISPIKSTTLARLELCAALLLCQLLQKIILVFKMKFSFASINLYSDSDYYPLLVKLTCVTLVDICIQSCVRNSRTFGKRFVETC